MVFAIFWGKGEKFKKFGGNNQKIWNIYPIFTHNKHYENSFSGYFEFLFDFFGIF